MVATLWGEHRVVGTRSQLPPPLADLDDDDEIWLRWCLETPNLGWWWVKGLLLCFIVRFPNCNDVREPDKLWLALIVQYTLAMFAQNQRESWRSVWWINLRVLPAVAAFLFYIIQPESLRGADKYITCWFGLEAKTRFSNHFHFPCMNDTSTFCFIYPSNLI